MERLAYKLGFLGIGLLFITAGSVHAAVDFECTGKFNGQFTNGEYGRATENTKYNGSIKLVARGASDDFPGDVTRVRYALVADESYMIIDVDQEDEVKVGLRSVNVHLNNSGKYDYIYISHAQTTPPVMLSGVAQEDSADLLMSLVTEKGFLEKAEFPVSKDINLFEYKRFQVNNQQGRYKARMGIDNIELRCNSTKLEVCGSVSESLNITAKDLPIVEYSDRKQFGCKYTSEKISGEGPITLLAKCPPNYTLLYPGHTSKQQYPTYVGTKTTEEQVGLQQLAEFGFYTSATDGEVDIETYAYCRENTHSTVK